MKSKHIFISYRRADSAAMAGRISDQLSKYFPKLKIFMDVDTIAGGDDFSARIFSAIKDSDIFICLIGSKWAVNEQGQNRILLDNDYVKKEIATALESQCKIYPILLNDCKMPATETLPSDIQPLCSLNALELRNSRFNDDLMHIIENIFEIKRDKLYKKKSSILIKSILYGLPSGYLVLFLFAQLNYWINNKSLALSLGENLTTFVILIAPVIASLLIYKRINK